MAFTRLMCPCCPAGGQFPISLLRLRGKNGICSCGHTILPLLNKQLLFFNQANGHTELTHYQSSSLTEKQCMFLTEGLLKKISLIYSLNSVVHVSDLDQFYIQVSSWGGT